MRKTRVSKIEIPFYQFRFSVYGGLFYIYENIALPKSNTSIPDKNEEIE
jgi:hypothetical protein